MGEVLIMIGIATAIIYSICSDCDNWPENM